MRISVLSVILGFILLLSSCSDFNKLVKSGNINKQLEAGIEYYKKKDYYKASVLLDEVVPLFKGKEEGEKAQYYQAMTYYDDKQYIMSAYYFKEFQEAYPRSDKAEECAFLYAKSMYNDSPDYNLDQENTEAAITALQAFANRYPKSAYIEEANKITDILTKKLEYKTYENTKLYYKIRNYKSAVISFTNFMEKYPESIYFEEIMFLKFNAQYDLAKRSVEGDKKKDRFMDAIEYYHEFIDKYPNSKYRKTAESLFETCEKEVKSRTASNS